MVIATDPKGTWVQCTSCGEIYFIEETVPIDKLYVTSICPRCDDCTAINCGNKEDDIILYCDQYLDERYFRYN